MQRRSANARAATPSAAELDPIALSGSYMPSTMQERVADDVPMLDFSTARPYNAKIGVDAMLPEMPKETKTYRDCVTFEYVTYGIAVLILLAVTGTAFGTAFNSTFRYHSEFFDPEVSTNAHVATICEAGNKCARAPARLGTNVSANTRYMLILSPAVVALVYILGLLIKYVGQPPAIGEMSSVGAFFNRLRPDQDADHLSISVDLPVMTGVVLLQAVALPLMNFTFVLDNFRIVLMIVVQTCAMLGLHTVAQAMPGLNDLVEEIPEGADAAVGSSKRGVSTQIRGVQSTIVLTLYMLYAFVGAVFIGMLVYQLISIDDVGPNLKFNRRMTYTITITSMTAAFLRLVAVGIAAFDTNKWLASHGSADGQRGQYKPLYKIVHTVVLVSEIAIVSFTYFFCAYRKWA